MNIVLEKDVIAWSVNEQGRSDSVYLYEGQVIQDCFSSEPGYTKGVIDGGRVVEINNLHM